VRRNFDVEKGNSIYMSGNNLKDILYIVTFSLLILINSSETAY
jgi:hypothetical protein